MANRRSPFVNILYTRISDDSKEWLRRRVPGRYPSFSSYIDQLIQKDKRKKIKDKPHGRVA